MTITTKSPLVLRDLDLLKSFAAYGGIRVHLSVSVLGEDLWRLLEPMTPKPLARLEALRDLRGAGIPPSVFLAPLVPVLGDAEALRVLEASAGVGATPVMVQPLRLSPGLRDWRGPSSASTERASRSLRSKGSVGSRRSPHGAPPQRLDRPFAPLPRRYEQFTLFTLPSGPRRTRGLESPAPRTCTA